jgi:hypothetical protein
MPWALQERGGRACQGQGRIVIGLTSRRLKRWASSDTIGPMAPSTDAQAMEAPDATPLELRGTLDHLRRGSSTEVAAHSCQMRFSREVEVIWDENNAAPHKLLSKTARVQSVRAGRKSLDPRQAIFGIRYLFNAKAARRQLHMA